MLMLNEIAKEIAELDAQCELGVEIDWVRYDQLCATRERLSK